MLLGISLKSQREKPETNAKLKAVTKIMMSMICLIPKVMQEKSIRSLISSSPYSSMMTLKIR
jgi:hypothetical protein